jgi:hypothetical protein
MLAPMPDATPLFERVDDGSWLPTDFARGPWDLRALHGGPVAALVARAVEQVDAPGDEAPMHPARLTIELVRPVPVEPLTVATEVVRPGRRVQLVAMTVAVAATGVEVTRALALRIRENPGLHPAPISPELAGGRVAEEDELPPGAAGGEEPQAFFLPTSEAASGDVTAFHSHAVEHRFVEGHFHEPGPATDWIRLRVPVVAGEEPSPWQRTAAAADFGNGLSGVLDPAVFTYINPDLTITLTRLPAGEWVCLRSATRLGVDGVAVAESVLFDEQGRIGRAAQTLLVAPR